MCEFCKDLMDDEGPIRVMEIPLKLGTKQIGASELWIESPNEHGVKLCLAVCNLDGDYAYEKYKAIKYCPFCGQEYKKIFLERNSYVK